MMDLKDYKTRALELRPILLLQALTLPFSAMKVLLANNI
jgi:hypothetical protein